MESNCFLQTKNQKIYKQIYFKDILYFKFGQNQMFKQQHPLGTFVEGVGAGHLLRSKM